MAQWNETAYTRLLVDNHISEATPELMTKYDPQRHAAMAKKAGAQEVMLYACCHNGNCYYPSKVGHMHKNLAGRDVFGEAVAAMREQGIFPTAYYTVIYHNHSARDNPQWQATSVRGAHNDGRYWHSCPSHRQYVEFSKAQISEVVAYDVDGIFIDMVFWPGVCVCDACRERYRSEAGREIPNVVDFGDERWIHFQRARERWMAEFAQELADSVRKQRPDITVAQQFSPVLLGWYLAQSPGIVAACDYASGDFYGGRDQQRLATKVMSAFSPTIPFEFHTSRCVTLRDHTSMKSVAEMTCSAATTLAAGGAYHFIDAINPDGTLEDAVYERLGCVAEGLAPFRDAVAAMRPIPAADVGVYYSMASHVSDALNGTELTALKMPGTNMSHTSGIPTIEELLGATRVLSRAHVPYRMVTSETTSFDGLTALLVHNAMFLSREEVERIRRFVSDGGALIATGMTSVWTLDGKTSGDFALADVFGVSWSGRKSMPISYLAFASGELVVSQRTAPLVKATTAQSLAKVSEPLFDPSDTEHYASIHSNPPGPAGEFDGLTANRFGAGTCVYLYSDIAARQEDAQEQFMAGLFREHAPSGVVLDCNAPVCVEVTLLGATVGRGYLVCFVNYQQDLPNVPARDVRTTVRLPADFTPTSCRAVSGSPAVRVDCQQNTLTIHVPELETVEMIEVK